MTGGNDDYGLAIAVIGRGRCDGRAALPGGVLPAVPLRASEDADGRRVG